MQASSSRPSNSRRVAADILRRWLQEGSFPDRCFGADTPDAAFLMDVVYGVVRQRRTLEWFVSRCAGRRPDIDVLPYVLIGAYQVMLMRVPDHAAVYETVEALRAAGLGHASGFVNAVLRALLRKKDALLGELAQQPPGVRWSHPDVLLTRWQHQLSDPEIEALCTWNNRVPDTCLHPNTLVSGLDAFRARLRDAGIAAEPHPAKPDTFLVLPHGHAVRQIPGYGAGSFSVQDPATMLSVDLMDARPGERVLDACAAPGGKTILLAQAMHDSGEIVAADLHADRVALLRDSVARMRLSSVRIVQADAATFVGSGADWCAGGFDRILLDVPCTNTGVLRRRPDARWRFSLQRLQRLVGRQRMLLESVWPLLRVGGRLVYSTCSLEPEENEDQITSWLQQHSDAREVGSVRAVPPRCGTDGAFAAAVDKVKE
jgi:16S rRNA (cytosine967-C5)-methyltransferase